MQVAFGAGALGFAHVLKSCGDSTSLPLPFTSTSLPFTLDLYLSAVYLYLYPYTSLRANSPSLPLYLSTSLAL